MDSGEGLLSWLEQAHLVPIGVIKTMRAEALPGELDKVADQARNLREWFRRFVHKHKGRPLDAKCLVELEPLNRLLERDEAFSRIVFQKETNLIALDRTRRWRSPESLVLPIAEELAQFVSSEDFSKIKLCEGPACTLLFADQTRGGARRWCSMSICGNRAKQATHRKRSREREQ
jgi:predicted RNA-binding Zn ribbon-like protein